jgi:hypothetical protein
LGGRQDGRRRIFGGARRQFAHWKNSEQIDFVRAGFGNRPLAINRNCMGESEALACASTG